MGGGERCATMPLPWVSSALRKADRSGRMNLARRGQIPELAHDLHRRADHTDRVAAIGEISRTTGVDLGQRSRSPRARRTEAAAGSCDCGVSSPQNRTELERSGFFACEKDLEDDRGAKLQ